MRQVDGTNRLIDKPYSEYDLGTVFSQYLSNITDFSSFDGWAPSVEAGPPVLLGPPDCDYYGDCGRPPPAWNSDTSIDPPLGTLLYVHYQGSYGGAHGYSGGRAAAFLREIHSDGTVSVEMKSMWKFDGEVGDLRYAGDPHYPEDSWFSYGSSYSYAYDGWYHHGLINISHPDVGMRRCSMQPNAAGRMLYPQECVTNLSLTGNAPEIKRVPRGWLRSNDEWLAWMPSSDNSYDGSKSSADYRSVHKLAFGPWVTLAFDRHDAYHNSVLPFSEFIQATIEKSVYIVGVRIGFPKGGGALAKCISK